MRSEGVRDATSISESKSTTASNAQQDSMFRTTIRTVFPLWLDLDKNLNKTIVVQNTGNRGPGVPGFYCETCNRTYKDSAGYLDHINGRARTFIHFRASE